VRRLSRALVVGGAGFFGTWLVDALLDEGVETVALDQRPPSGLAAAAKLVHGEAIDVDAEFLDALGVDAVFQLAGSGSVPPTLLRPLDDLHRNAVTTLSVLEAARHTRCRPLFVFVSSAAVYGEGERMPMPEDHTLKPVSPYGISKLAAEHYVSLYAGLHELPTFLVRPFSLYGPRQRKLVVYDLLTRLLDGESPLTVHGSADVTRDFVFVQDAARALVTLARAAPGKGEAYNIASGRPITLGGLVSTLLELTGGSTVAHFTGTVRAGDPLRWEGDPARARALGARCETSLREGLARTVEWVIREREAEAVA
jgi:UDP-glucose 4-epimerase